MLKVRQAAVPAYLFLCIVLGGSGQSIWGHLALQILGLAISAWAVLRPTKNNTHPPFGALIAIGAAATGLILIQLIPLPPQLWTQLPGRGFVVRGFQSLGEPLPWLPLSLDPFDTWSSALALIPPVAIVIGTVRLGRLRPTWAVFALLSATILNVLLGYLQVITKSPHWYLYEFTNIGSAVGFFANRDHMATLLVVVIPFIAAQLSYARGAERRKGMPIAVTAITSLILVLTGIAMNGSLAGVLLALPVVAASALLFGNPSRRLRSIALIAILCGFVISIALLANSPVQGKLTGTETASITGRKEIWNTSLKAGSAAFPVGTGFGTFEKVYHLYEDRDAVTQVYVNHAHNDFIELFVEGGALAIGLIACFLIWWIAAVRHAFANAGTDLSRAAAIASAAIIAHSLVDFPLRTAAIAAVFAFCIALMAAPVGQRRKSVSLSEDDGARRHVEIR